MGFLALLNAYAMRVCLSITITEMVQPRNTTHGSADDKCNVTDEDLTHPNQTIRSDAKLYDWDPVTQVKENLTDFRLLFSNSISLDYVELY